MSVNYRSKGKVLEEYDFYYDVIDRRKIEEMENNGFVEVSKNIAVNEYIIDYSEETCKRCYDGLSLYRFLYDMLRNNIREKNINKLLS